MLRASARIFSNSRYFAGQRGSRQHAANILPAVYTNTKPLVTCYSSVPLNKVVHYVRDMLMEWTVRWESLGTSTPRQAGNVGWQWNPVSAVNECCQQQHRGDQEPTYVTVRVGGGDHTPVFVTTLSACGCTVTSDEYGEKSLAKRSAARRWLIQMQNVVDVVGQQDQSKQNLTPIDECIDIAAEDGVANSLLFLDVENRAKDLPLMAELAAKNANTYKLHVFAASKWSQLSKKQEKYKDLAEFHVSESDRNDAADVLLMATLQESLHVYPTHLHVVIGEDGIYRTFEDTVKQLHPDAHFLHQGKFDRKGIVVASNRAQTNELKQKSVQVVAGESNVASDSSDAMQSIELGSASRGSMQESTFSDVKHLTEKLFLEAMGDLKRRGKAKFPNPDTIFNSMSVLSGNTFVPKKSPFKSGKSLILAMESAGHLEMVSEEEDEVVKKKKKKSKETPKKKKKKKKKPAAAKKSSKMGTPKSTPSKSKIKKKKGKKEKEG